MYGKFLKGHITEQVQVRVCCRYLYFGFEEHGDSQILHMQSLEDAFFSLQTTLPQLQFILKSAGQTIKEIYCVLDMHL